MTTYEHTYTITAQNILDHVDAAQDSNKIHNQGKNSVVPGTLLAGLARDAGNELIQLAELNGYHWNQQDITFRKAIFADTDITVHVDPLGKHKNTYRANQSIIVDGEVAAKSKITYSKNVPYEFLVPFGKPCTLTGDAAGLIATSQHKQGLAIQDLALSRISPILLEAGQDLVQEYRAQGKDPLYVKQSFTAYDSMPQLLSGDTIHIGVTQNQPGKTRLGYEIPLLAIHSNGRVVYKATATLDFAKLEDLLHTHQER